MYRNVGKRPLTYAVLTSHNKESLNYGVAKAQNSGNFVSFVAHAL